MERLSFSRDPGGRAKRQGGQWLAARHREAHAAIGVAAQDESPSSKILGGDGDPACDHKVIDQNLNKNKIFTTTRIMFLCNKLKPPLQEYKILQRLRCNTPTCQLVSCNSRKTPRATSHLQVKSKFNIHEEHVQRTTETNKKILTQQTERTLGTSHNETNVAQIK